MTGGRAGAGTPSFARRGPDVSRPYSQARADAGEGRLDAGEGRADVLLVCSTGGHLLQLVSLRDSWDGYSSAWVTFDKSDSRAILRGERVFYAHGPTNRSIRNLIRNLGLAWRLVSRLRPKVIVTTGAGVGVPFVWIGRLRGTTTVYIESFTRIEGPSVSCRLVRPVADHVFVQWSDLQRLLPSTRFAGTVFGDR